MKLILAIFLVLSQLSDGGFRTVNVVHTTRVTIPDGATEVRIWHAKPLHRPWMLAGVQHVRDIRLTPSTG